jgi:hypothetical protein
LNEELLHEWEDASVARETGDSDAAKNQAIVAGKFVLAEVGLSMVGQKWDDLPFDEREAAIDTMTMRAKDLGLSIRRNEISRQAQCAIDYRFNLPEKVAFKVIYESYVKDPVKMEQRQRALGLLMRVAEGEHVEEIPEKIRERIQRRVSQHKRYVVAATDLREACGRKGYLVDSYQDDDLAESILEDEETAAVAMEALFARADNDPAMQGALRERVRQSHDRWGRQDIDPLTDEEICRNLLSLMDHYSIRLFDCDIPETMGEFVDTHLDAVIGRLQNVQALMQSRLDIENQVG